MDYKEIRFKSWSISWLAKRLLASQQSYCSMELAASFICRQHLNPLNFLTEIKQMNNEVIITFVVIMV
jgi:hypothetical protein